MKSWMLPLAVLTTLAAEGTTRAQGFIIPTLGTRKNGMGVAVGRVDDLSAIYHNPAALALMRGTQVGVSFGAAILSVDLRAAPWPDSDKYLTDPVDSEGYYPRQTPTVFAPIPMLGASTNLWSDKLVAALGIYVPNAAGADFGEDQPTRYHIIDAYVFSAFFTAAVAYRPWPWLAVGVGGSAVYIRIKRRSLLFPVINETDFSALLGSQTELEIEGDDVQPAFSLGIQAWPHRTLSLGFMMLSRYDVELEGPLRLKPGPDASPLIRKPEWTENEHRTEVIAPWIFCFGANWDITPWLEVGAEFRFYLNSQVDQQVTTITKGEVLRTVLPDGLVTPKNLHDSFHTGGGFNVRPFKTLGLELMTGVHYEDSASPDNTVEVSAPTFNLLAGHLGARWTITDRFRLSLSYMQYWYLQRRTTDSITRPPTNFVGSGKSSVIVLVFDARVAPGIGVGKK
jgi:long-subunit fatty acid transport protein